MKTKRVCPYCNGTGFIESEEDDYPKSMNYPEYPQFKEKETTI